MTKKVESIIYKSVVYWASIEYLYGYGSAQYGSAEGGLVYAFVKANDAQDALGKILTALQNMGLIIMLVEYISPYEKGREWEKAEDEKYFDGLCDQAERVVESVIFSDFSYYLKYEDEIEEE